MLRVVYSIKYKKKKHLDKKENIVNINLINVV